MYYVTPKQMKTIELNADKSGVSYEQLMDNAGLKIAEFINNLQIDFYKGIIFLCGKGNNAGDGFVAAKNLSETGMKITVVLMDGDPSTELSVKKYCELSESKCDVLFLNDNIDKIFNIISNTALIVDCVYGTGFHGEIAPQIKACFSYSARSCAKKLSVDVPSGGNCTNGLVAEGTLKSNYTVTFAFEKIGMVQYPLKDYCGEVTIADIGIKKDSFANIERPIINIEVDQVKKLIPERSPTSHKGTFGKLLNISGSKNMTGAASLSTLAALRSGVGLCYLGSTDRVCRIIGSNMYEPLYLNLKENKNGAISIDNIDFLLEKCKSMNAVILGCGLSVDEDTKQVVSEIINNCSCTIILDADGINCISSCIDIIRNKKASIVITPHIGELARLCNCSISEVTNNRLEYAIKLSSDYGITVVAKGTPTFIAGENGFCYVSTTGNAGLSRGGSGDILTGMIGSFVAQGMSAVDAAVSGTFLHGLAADMTAQKLSMQGMLPSDVISELPLLFKDLNK